MGMGQGHDMATVLITGGEVSSAVICSPLSFQEMGGATIRLQEIDSKDPLCLAGCDCFVGDARSMDTPTNHARMRCCCESLQRLCRTLNPP